MVFILLTSYPNYSVLVGSRDGLESDFLERNCFFYSRSKRELIETHLCLYCFGLNNSFTSLSRLPLSRNDRLYKVHFSYFLVTGNDDTFIEMAVQQVECHFFYLFWLLRWTSRHWCIQLSHQQCEPIIHCLHTIGQCWYHYNLNAKPLCQYWTEGPLRVNAWNNVYTVWVY